MKDIKYMAKLSQREMLSQNLERFRRSRARMLEVTEKLKHLREQVSAEMRETQELIVKSRNSINRPER